MQRVTDFRANYWFLSNFFPCPVAFQGVYYPSSEHLFMSMKAFSIADAWWVKSSETCGEAKRRGRVIKLRPDWEHVKIGVMRDVVRLKFHQNCHLGDKLKQTHPMELVEGNTWGDRIWGQVFNPDTCAYEGQNLLGKILMDVRDELLEKRIPLITMQWCWEIYSPVPFVQNKA